MIDIENAKSECYNCYQVVVQTLANYYKKNFEMIALGQLVFAYNGASSTDSPRSIGKCIEPYERRIVKGEKLVHGLSSFRIAIDENVIKEYLDDFKPLVVRMDLFHCHWSEAYKKYSFPHFLIINGYDLTNRVFFCKDPYFNLESIKLSIVEIIKVADSVQVFEFKETEVDLERILLELINDADHYFDSKSSENIDVLINDIENRFCVELEMENYGNDLFAVPILDNLKIIGQTRAAYTKMLDYLSTQYIPEIEEHTTKMKDISDAWRLARIYLIKVCVSKNPKHLSKVIELLRFIKIQENALMNQLKIVVLERIVNDV